MKKGDEGLRYECGPSLPSAAVLQRWHPAHSHGLQPRWPAGYAGDSSVWKKLPKDPRAGAGAKGKHAKIKNRRIPVSCSLRRSQKSTSQSQPQHRDPVDKFLCTKFHQCGNIGFLRKFTRKNSRSGLISRPFKNLSGAPEAAGLSGVLRLQVAGTPGQAGDPSSP